MKDRSPRKLSRKEALYALIALAGGAFACAYADVPIITAIPPRTSVPTGTLPFDISDLTKEVLATPLPSGTPMPTETETPTQVPTSTIEKPKPPEVMMPFIGNTYLGDPFEIYLPEKTAELAAFWDGEKTFSVDDPFLVLQNELTQEEYETMNPHNIIKTPRVGLVFQTDNRRDGTKKHLVIDAHSGYSLLGQELPLNFFKKILNMNPEKLIGATLSLLQNNLLTNLEVVHYTIITEERFNQSFFNYKVSDDPAWRSVPVFFSFSSLGPEIIDLNSPPFNSGDDLITFIACYGPEGDLTSGRMLITAKLLP